MHGGERTTSHDVVRNVLVAIARNARFHVLRKQPMSFCPMPYGFHVVESTLCYQSMVFTLVDVIITNPTQVDLVSQVVLFHEVVTTVVA